MSQQFHKKRPRNVSSKNFYEILQIATNASQQQIKIAYYKLAQTLHPDKHKGSKKKQAEFQSVTEAYNTLSVPSKRLAYDFHSGANRYNSGRRTAPPPNYRKVYTTVRPPKHWKTTWDHQKHYEMHYGNGFRDAAIKAARNHAIKRGDLNYKSVLGRGFTFNHAKQSNHRNRKSNTKDDDDDEEHNFSHADAASNPDLYNPYSRRTQQGPPSLNIEYSEGTGLGGKETTVHDMVRFHSARKKHVVSELHRTRNIRTDAGNKHGSNNGQTRAEYVAAQRAEHKKQSKLRRNSSLCTIM